MLGVCRFCLDFLNLTSFQKNQGNKRQSPNIFLCWSLGHRKISEFVFFTTQKYLYFCFILDKIFEKTENCWDSCRLNLDFLTLAMFQKNDRAPTFFYVNVFRLTGLRLYLVFYKSWHQNAPFDKGPHSSSRCFGPCHGSG